MEADGGQGWWLAEWAWERGWAVWHCSVGGLCGAGLPAFPPREIERAHSTPPPSATISFISDQTPHHALNTCRRRFGEETVGFRYVASGPLVRSSYRAGEFFVEVRERGRGGGACVTPLVACAGRLWCHMVLQQRGRLLCGGERKRVLEAVPVPCPCCLCLT